MTKERVIAAVVALLVVAAIAGLMFSGVFEIGF
jgi:hypothetical protein